MPPSLAGITPLAERLLLGLAMLVKTLGRRMWVAAGAVLTQRRLRAAPGPFRGGYRAAPAGSTRLRRSRADARVCTERARCWSKKRLSPIYCPALSTCPLTYAVVGSPL